MILSLLLLLIAVLPSSYYDLHRNINGILLAKRRTQWVEIAAPILWNSFPYQLDRQVLSKILREHVKKIRLIYLLRRIINLLPFVCFYHCYNHYCYHIFLIVHSFYDNIKHEILFKNT